MELTSEISTDHYLCEVFQEVFNSHAKDSIVLFPGVHETWITFIRPDFLVRLQELHLYIFIPELVQITTSTIPFNSIVPWVLKSD